MKSLARGEIRCILLLRKVISLISIARLSWKLSREKRATQMWFRSSIKGAFENYIENGMMEPRLTIWNFNIF